MHAVAFGRRNKVTDLVEAFGRQPAIAAAPLHGKTIGRLFVRPSELVAALVRENPLLYWRRNFVEQARVHNEKAGIRRTVIIEGVVNDCRSLSAQLLAAIKLEFAWIKNLRVATNLRHVLFGRRRPIFRANGQDGKCGHRRNSQRKVQTGAHGHVLSHHH